MGGRGRRACVSQVPRRGLWGWGSGGWGGINEEPHRHVADKRRDRLRGYVVLRWDSGSRAGLNTPLIPRRCNHRRFIRGGYRSANMEAQHIFPLAT